MRHSATVTSARTTSPPETQEPRLKKDKMKLKCKRCTMIVKTVARNGDAGWSRIVRNVVMGYTGRTRRYACWDWTW